MSPKFERIDAYDLDEAPLLFPIGWEKNIIALGVKIFIFPNALLILLHSLTFKKISSMPAG